MRLTVVEDQLEHVQDHEGRKEGVEVDVEAVAELDVGDLLGRWPGGGDSAAAGRHPARAPHEGIGGKPEDGRHGEPHEDHVHEDDPEEELDRREDGQLEDDREAGRRDEEPASEEDQKGGIVPRELVFGLLSILRVAESITMQNN